jgi:putative ABC transport system permease protein
MRSLLRLISLRHVRRHRARTFLTAAGIALGVAAVVAIGLVSSSVTLGLRQIVSDLAGGSQLIVSGDRTGVPEELLEAVLEVPGVEHASPVVKQVVELRSVAGKPVGGRLQIYAVDSLDEEATPSSAFRREDLDLPDSMRFITQPRSVIVTKSFAEKHGLEGSIGSATIVVTSGQGTVELTVRGILRRDDSAQVFGGNLGLMDTYSAQKVFDRGPKFDEIHLHLAEGSTLEQVSDVRARVSAAIGRGFDVERPMNRGRQSERIVHAWQAAMALLSLVTLFVGAFLVYNTVSVSVVERRREIGVLRSLGVRRGQIAGMFLIETLLLGAIGSAVGLLGGMFAARALLRLTTDMMGQLLLDTGIEELRYSPEALAIGLAAGLTLAVGSALAPAIAAARLHPVDALLTLPTKKRRTRLVFVSTGFGLIFLAAAAVGCLSPASRKDELLASGTLLSLLLGSVLMCPFLVPAGARALAALLERFSGPIGRLAGSQLRRADMRATVTVAAIAVGVALVVSSSSVAQSFRVSISAYVARTTVADILVTCSTEIFSPASAPMAPAVEQALAGHPAVDELQRVRVIDLTVGGRRADLFALDVAAWDRRVGFPFLRGDRRTAARELALGRGVAVSENFANTFGLDVGDDLTFPTPKGEVSLPVLGVFLDYSTAFGAVVIDRRVHQQYWQDDLTDLFHVYLKPDADVQKVRTELEAAVAERYNVFVLTTATVRDKIQGLLDDLFLLTRLQDLIAAAVALLGLINTLIIAVIERRRDLAVLRAIGASRWQVGASVVLEALALAAVGCALGIAIGLGLGWVNVDVVATLHTGWRFDFHVNWAMVLELVVLVLLAAAAAAWIPARRAARAEIARGLAGD